MLREFGTPTPARPPARPLHYDARLARRVLDGEPDATQAAVVLFERHEPDTLDDAARLVSAHGELTPSAFDAVADAFDIHRLQRDMPFE